MNRFFDLMETYDEGEIFLNFIKTIILFVVIYALNKGLSYITKKFMNNQKVANIINRTFTYLSFIIGVIYGSRFWFDRTKSSIFLIGAIIALSILASKDLVSNISAWFYIQGRDMFEIGDRIEIDDVIGDVVDIGILHTYLSEVKGRLLDKESETGRFVSIPNSYIFDKPFYNYCHDFKFVWTEINLMIPFDAPYEKALQIAGKLSFELYENMLNKYDENEIETFKKVSNSYDQKLKPEIRADLNPQGILIYITFFVRYNEVGKIKSYYQFKLWEEFKKNNIPVIFPKSLLIEEK